MLDAPSVIITAAGVDVREAEEQRFEFTRIVLQEGLDLREVWTEYAALSGRTSEKDLIVYAVGGMMLPERERDLIARAVQRILGTDPKTIIE